VSKKSEVVDQIRDSEIIGAKYFEFGRILAKEEKMRPRQRVRVINKEGNSRVVLSKYNMVLVTLQVLLEP
jgi:hypothetical protein